MKSSTEPEQYGSDANQWNLLEIPVSSPSLLLVGTHTRYILESLVWSVPLVQTTACYHHESSAIPTRETGTAWSVE